MADCGPLQKAANIKPEQRPPTRNLNVDAEAYNSSRRDCLGTQLVELDALKRARSKTQQDALAKSAQYGREVVERRAGAQQRRIKFSEDEVRFKESVKLSVIKVKAQNKRALSAISDQQTLTAEAEQLRAELEDLRRERDAGAKVLGSDSGALEFLHRVAMETPEYVSADGILAHYETLREISAEQQATMFAAVRSMNACRERVRTMLAANNLALAVHDLTTHQLIDTAQGRTMHSDGLWSKMHGKLADRRSEMLASRNVTLSIRNMVFQTPYGSRGAGTDLCDDLEHIADHILYLSAVLEKK